MCLGECVIFMKLVWSYSGVCGSFKFVVVLYVCIIQKVIHGIIQNVCGEYVYGVRVGCYG